MAEAEERMLNPEEALEEQRRAELAAEAKERRVQPMELILQIADLEHDSDRITNKLRRMCNQSLSRFNFSRMEDLYIGLIELNTTLRLKVNDWEELLETHESGEPVYPARGMPEYLYSPEAKDFARKTKSMEEILSLSQDTLMKFLMSLSPADQRIVSLEAKTAFLKNPQAWEAAYRVLDQEEEDEEEEAMPMKLGLQKGLLR